MHSGYYTRSDILKNFELHGELKMCVGNTTDKREKRLMYSYVMDMKSLTIFFFKLKRLPECQATHQLNNHY